MWVEGGDGLNRNKNGGQRGFSSGYRGFLPLGRVVRNYCSATELPGRDPLVEPKPEGEGGEDDRQFLEDYT